ncbi:ABC transporter ATP-binding protein/permease [Steroidobacter sp. S1-65]|uniref:ABC transporter ATP-binding protein/permease n=1 Tax=Steroidobacter gossypii TaxID=2805490 RepID=A0ABS1X614_9GAMM|nr:ATP-binding cassette domain-containing protein [Steroidobacter gossypii]MBM0108672.1 ABC transporter ATP-binding protein/permease [Steroidobacter gossypii]
MSRTDASVGAIGTSEAVRQPRQTLREALQLLWSAADGFAKRRLLVALALVAGGSLLAAATPIALKLLVDSLAQEGTGAGGAALATALVFLGLYVLGMYLGRVVSEARLFLHLRAEQRVQRQVGRRLFEHLVRLPLRFHLEKKTGAIGETVTQGMRGYQLLLQHFIHTFLPVIIEFVAVALVLAHFGHAEYISILAVASIAYVYAFQRGAIAIQEPSRLASRAHIDANAVLTDSLINHETVKYFDAEPVVCNRYDLALGRTERSWARFFALRAKNSILVHTIFGLSLAVTSYFALVDVFRGAMTVGDFVLLNAYVIRLVQPLEMIGLAVRDTAQGVAFLDSLLALFREQTEIEAVNARSAAAPRGELQFDRVCFSYHEARAVLRNVSFAVPAGKTVAVVGASGSGKSSLIRLLFRLYEPNAGAILLDGTPIRDLSLSALRQAIAVVPQDTVMFHDTIANNIGFGRADATLQDIQEAARIANLHEFILTLPDGYDTMVGERGLKLSGGERQRVAIARAALKKPKIFVFDEATSSLDTQTEREILRNLIEVSAHSTTLVIAHRLSTIVHADEIIVLDRGAVRERGTHAQLCARNGAYAGLWQAQQGGLSQREELPISPARK